ncbi:glycosyltransferase family 2 protein [Jiella endophytica]|uniref:Glycosyltransferase family 2 protein n=1 Tax=Jiella endophytica TaxID=2558362 RepID=A0A4Y8RNC8_9HYPH|nr:glycosyltransferase [Jiella endophytica]TFF25108.1 glycosyltransferase family 2 protein [Jiella endophytica]
MRLCVVVPTRNRPRELAALLTNLSAQAHRPAKIVVVDGSDDCLAAEIADIVAAAGPSCRYLRHWPPSAAAQRNAGIDAVIGEADLVALIDDDVTLDPEALDVVCRKAAVLDPAIIGFGLNPLDVDAQIGHGSWKTSWLTKRLGLYSDEAAAVSPSGWHTRILHVAEETEARWLTSCAVVWRAEAISDLRFDEYFEAYSYLEDLDFSLQACRRGRFVILPDATYLHVPAKGGRKSRFWFGRIEVRNRHYIVCKHGLSRWRFWLGTAIRAAMTGAETVSGKREEFDRLVGNVAEIAAVVRRLGGAPSR